jgi:hypothetical protein
MKTKYSRREFGWGWAVLGSGLMALDYSHAAFGYGLRTQLERDDPRSALLTISPDGAKVALSVSGQPSDIFRFRSGKWASVADKLAPDLLKVIELATGSVVYEALFRARVFPASFFADGLRIYAETVPFNDKGRVVHQCAVINLSTGERQDQFIPVDLERTTSVDALHDDLLLLQTGVAKINRSISLAEVSWPRIETEFQVEYATAARESKGHDFEKYLSADRGTLLYAFDHTIVCRRTKDLKVLWTAEVPSEYFGAWRLGVSADGRYVVAAVTDSPFSDKEKRFYVAVYDGRNGQALARLPITGTDGVAISPDGKLLAVAHVVFDKRGAVPTVFLYDVETGERVATVEHEPVHNNAFMNARFGSHGLAFSADGRHLVTSTNDTRVWALT